MKISIVIPNYNGEKLLRKNLPKIINFLDKGEVDELVIVDDGSTDGSVRYIKNEMEKSENIHYNFKFLIEKERKGFSSAVNAGVEAATSDLIVLLNTDVIPADNFLDSSKKYFKDNLVLAVGFLEENIENTGEKTARGRGIGRWHRGFLMHSRGETSNDNTLWVCAGSGIFRKDIWHKLGGLSTLFNPFYWEDIDLSYRAIKSGYKIYFDKNSKVIHYHPQGSIMTNFSKSYVKEIAYRNQLLFIWKDITDLEYLISHVVFLPYYIIKSAFTGDLVFIKAFFLAVAKLPMILNERRISKRLFIKKDKEILGYELQS